MAIRKVWFGSLGPFFYDDAVTVMDPDGVVTEYQAGVVVDGQITVINPPLSLTDVVRLEDLEGALEVIEPGTANGQMLYWDHTAGIWKHTETSELIWDDVNKRIGLNTTTPSERLHVAGNILTTGSISTQGRIKNITRVTTSPYTVVSTDEIIMVDTDAIIITVLLPTGTAGRVLEVINCGSSKNRVTITPNGAELLFGVNNSEYAYDAESIVMAYDTIEGWF